MEIIESRQASPVAEWPKDCVHVISGKKEWKILSAGHFPSSLEVVDTNGDWYVDLLVRSLHKSYQSTFLSGISHSI